MIEFKFYNLSNIMLRFFESHIDRKAKVTISYLLTDGSKLTNLFKNRQGKAIFQQIMSDYYPPS